MMNKEMNRSEFNYQVVCVWCDTVIRSHSTKNSQGMCLQCHARIVREHSRNYEQAGKLFKASER